MAGGIRRADTRANHPVAWLVVTAEAFSGPVSHRPWSVRVGAQAAAPTWVGISESRAVGVPRGARGRHGISKAATTPARDTLEEG